MLKFTILKGRILLDPNIVLLEDLNNLYLEKRGEKLLQVIYYLNSRDIANPFRDLDQITLMENILMSVFKVKNFKSLKLSKKEQELYTKAEKIFIKFNSTSESRLERSINKKLDEISELLDDTTPVIEESTTSSGETKFSSNLTIILNLFTKIETIMKSKTVLQNIIMKQENKGRVKGGGTTSFREMGI